MSDGVTDPHPPVRLYHERSIIASSTTLKSIPRLPIPRPRFASPRLKAHKGVVSRAVESDGYALNFASDELRQDESFVRAMIATSSDAISAARPGASGLSDLNDDKEFVLRTIISRPVMGRDASFFKDVPCIYKESFGFKGPGILEYV